jgi:hypothetical protein
MTQKFITKVDTLAALLGAKEWSYGESDRLGWEYYLEFSEVQNSTAAKRHGGSGEALIYFHSVQAMHRYLDDKIKLFRSNP